MERSNVYVPKMGDMKLINAYILETFKPVDPILREVLERANRLQIPNYHVGDMAGQHIEVLIRMAGYKKAIEIGTLAGYSGICIARGLGPDGVLHTVDIDPKSAEIAKESFRKAGVADNIKVHTGNALDILETLQSEGPFDVVFIDADKVNYPNYFKWAEKNVRIGGAVIADNTFAWGTVCDPNPEKPDDVNGIRQFNAMVANSPHWRATNFPTIEGLGLAVKIA